MSRRLLPLLTALLSTAAAAQSVQINMDANGLSMTAEDGAAHVEAERTETLTESADDYRLKYVTSRNGKTQLEVLEPQGARVQFFEGDSLLATDDIPTLQRLKSDVWYRVEITALDGASWSRKIQAKAGMHGSLWVTRPNQGGPVARPLPPPPSAPRPPPGPVALGDTDFEALAQAIRGEDFSNDKLGVLQQAVSGSYFNIRQVGALVDLFDFSNDKLAAVRIVKPKIVDRQNAFLLSKHFEFSNDKQQAQAILSE